MRGKELVCDGRMEGAGGRAPVVWKAQVRGDAKEGAMVEQRLVKGRCVFRWMFF
jgi:hypothetical protein